MIMGTSKILAAVALAGTVLVSSAAGAAPAASSQAIAKQGDTNLQVVRDYGRHGGWRGRGHRGHGWNNGLGWGLGAAAVGGLLLGGAYGYGDDDYDEGYAYRGRYAGEGGEARCEATFRSFNPATGTYTGYDGVRRMCPYL
jgi:BA14K-like protein